MLQYYQNSAGTPDELAIEGSSDQVESEDEFSGDDESEGVIIIINLVYQCYSHGPLQTVHHGRLVLVIIS